MTTPTTTTAYVYLRNSDGSPYCHTVGFYDPSGKWNPESDYSTEDKAAARVAWLNGAAAEGDALGEALEACRVFGEWLDRESEGFGGAEARNAPGGEAAWREWYDENLRLCALAQTLARAILSKYDSKAKEVSHHG